MKKIVYALATALLLVGSLSSCDSKLDIKPVDSIAADQALLTSSDVEAAMVGCYTGIQNAEGYGGYIQLMSDLLGDDGEVTFVGTFIPPNQINRKSILKDNGFVAAIWLNAYNVINRTNNVLANLDKLDTPAKKARVEGEARFIRGAMYFELVRLYARDWADGTPASNPGVPLVLAPTRVVDASSQVARNSVAEVYAQVIADLTAAESRMTATSAAGTFFANNAAAAAMLSRVYLQQARFPEAAAAANRAITSRYSLNPSYVDEFFSGADLLGNSSEDIFAIQNSAQSGSNQLNVFYSQRGDVLLEDKHLNLYDVDDDRLNLFYITAGQPTYSAKYDSQYGNIKLIRLAEMYLNRAEANFRAGTSVGASPLTDLNRVRARVNLAPYATATLPQILAERKLELALEGFRLADVKRNRESVTDPNGVVLPWNSPRLIFPIPLREINANPKLTQNTGY